MRYMPEMYANRRNIRVIKGIKGIKEHNDDVGFFTKSGNRSMAVSRLRNEKKMQYNPYLWPNCRNFREWEKIGAKEHDGDVRFNDC